MGGKIAKYKSKVDLPNYKPPAPIHSHRMSKLLILVLLKLMRRSLKPQMLTLSELQRIKKPQLKR